MCYFNILYFLFYFHSKENPQSNLSASSPYFRPFPRPFLSCVISRSRNLLLLFPQQDYFYHVIFQLPAIFITISTARTILNQIYLLPVTNLSPDHFYHVLFQHLVVFYYYFHSKTILSCVISTSCNFYYYFHSNDNSQSNLSTSSPYFQSLLAPFYHVFFQPLII